MNKTEFEAMIAAHGANPMRWPEDRRTAAKHFAKTNPEAAALLAKEAELDYALDLAAVNPPSDLLRARILKSATGSPVILTKSTTAKRPAWRAIAASFAAVLTIGIVTYSVNRTSAPQDNSDDSVWLEAANDLGVDDIYLWVEGEP